MKSRVGNRIFYSSQGAFFEEMKCFTLLSVLMAGFVNMGQAVENPCHPEYMWTTEPSMSDIPAGQSYGPLCSGQSIEFSPSWGTATQNGICEDINECGGGSEVGQVSVVYSWEVKLNGQIKETGTTQTVNYGTTEPGVYTIELTKFGSANSTNCSWSHSSTEIVSVNVFCVNDVTLQHTGGVAEFDDGDGNSNTKLYLAGFGAGAGITAIATPLPSVASENDLPACWSFVGGAAINDGKLQRFTWRSGPQTVNFIASAGDCGDKSIEVVIYKAEIYGFAWAETGGPLNFNSGHSWWGLSLSSNARNALTWTTHEEAVLDDFIAGFWPEGGGKNITPYAPGPVAGATNTGDQGASPEGSANWYVDIYTFILALEETVDRWLQEPNNYHLYNYNCTHAAIEFVNSYTTAAIPSTGYPWNFEATLNNTPPPLPPVW